MSSWLTLRNAVAVPTQNVPHLPLEDFRQAIIAAPSRNRRVVALYGQPTGSTIELRAVLACDRDGLLEVARTTVQGNSFPSMTPECAQVHLFERELGEQWGLVAEGHPWWKPVRFHKSYRPSQEGQEGHDAWGGPADKSPTIGVTNFYRVDGDLRGQVVPPAAGRGDRIVAEVGRSRSETPRRLAQPRLRVLPPGR